MGKQLAQEVERQAKIIDDPIIAEYVNRIGQNLVRNSDAKVPFTIKVLDSEEVNAFALPGGFFFVNSGVLLNADNEAEMAGVMAHEIAHVAARHGTKQASRGELAQILTIPLYVMGGWTGYAIRQGMAKNPGSVAPPEDRNKPRLRRAPGSTNGPVDANPDGTAPKTDSDERPTLKRRDQRSEKRRVGKECRSPGSAFDSSR